MAVAQLRGVDFEEMDGRENKVIPAPMQYITTYRALEDVAGWLDLDAEDYNDLCTKSPNKIRALLDAAV